MSEFFFSLLLCRVQCHSFAKEFASPFATKYSGLHPYANVLQKDISFPTFLLSFALGLWLFLLLDLSDQMGFAGSAFGILSLPLGGIEAEKLNPPHDLRCCEAWLSSCRWWRRRRRDEGGKIHRQHILPCHKLSVHLANCNNNNNRNGNSHSTRDPGQRKEKHSAAKDILRKILPRPPRPPRHDTHLLWVLRHFYIFPLTDFCLAASPLLSLACHLRRLGAFLVQCHGTCAKSVTVERNFRGTREATPRDRIFAIFA